jgi:hypothetical protein
MGEAPKAKAIAAANQEIPRIAMREVAAAA